MLLELLNIDKASMIRKYHNHTLPTNPWHAMVEPQIPYFEQFVGHIIEP